MSVKDWPRWTQVLYVPPHAKGNLKHRDVLKGFVTSARISQMQGNVIVYCRYFYPDGSLRTTANSEGCDEEMLVKRDSFPQAHIDLFKPIVEESEDRNREVFSNYIGY